MAVFIVAISLPFIISLFFKKISLISFINGLFVWYLIFKYQTTCLPGYRYFAVMDFILLNPYLVKKYLNTSTSNIVKEFILYTQDILENKFNKL